MAYTALFPRISPCKTLFCIKCPSTWYRLPAVHAIDQYQFCLPSVHAVDHCQFCLPSVHAIDQYQFCLPGVHAVDERQLCGQCRSMWQSCWPRSPFWGTSPVLLWLPWLPCRLIRQAKPSQHQHAPAASCHTWLQLCVTHCCEAQVLSLPEPLPAQCAPGRACV